MFRSCQIVIGEPCSLLKLYYSIHNLLPLFERDAGNGFLCWQAHIKNDEYFVPCMSKGSAGEIGDATS